MTLSLPFATRDQQFPLTYLRMGKTFGAGAVIAGDMAVSPGSGLQVTLSVGEAYVQQTVARLGAFYASRGFYYVYNDSPATPYNSLPAPVSNPRVDLVVARVYDVYEQQLAGSSYWRYEWVEGSEQAGASLANQAGAPALPSNSLLRASILRQPGETSIAPNNIANNGVSTTSNLSPVFESATVNGELSAAGGVALAAGTNLTGRLNWRPNSAGAGNIAANDGDLIDNSSSGSYVVLNGYPAEGAEVVVVATAQTNISAGGSRIILVVSGSTLAVATVPATRTARFVAANGYWWEVTQLPTPWVPTGTAGAGGATYFSGWSGNVRARQEGDVVRLSGQLNNNGGAGGDGNPCFVVPFAAPAETATWYTQVLANANPVLFSIQNSTYGTTVGIDPYSEASYAGGGFCTFEGCTWVID